MEQVRSTILEEMERRLGELSAEAEKEGYPADDPYALTEEQKLKKHYAGPRIDVNTKGTFLDEDYALLANLKRYRAAVGNIENAEDRRLYGKLLDAAYDFYDWYAGLYATEKTARRLLDNEDPGRSKPQTFLVRAQALVLEASKACREYRRYVQILERFFRMTASKKGPGDEEEFGYRIRYEEDFPEDFRLALRKDMGIEWEDAAAVGEALHNTPPVLTRATMVLDGFSEELAEPYLSHEGTDAEFPVPDPYAVSFAVSNFDNAMQPLFSTSQVRMLREQKKSMYDMIFIDGTSIKELYAPLISRDQDPRQRGNEMKMRFMADILQGKKAEVSNGEKFLPLMIRIELPELRSLLEERILEAEWSEDRIHEMVAEENRQLIQWMNQLQEKMWGVIEPAVEENPDGIQDEEEIQRWLDGLLEIDELQ